MDALLLRANDIGFEFIAAEVIDRKPPPPGTKVLHFKTVSFDVNATDSVTFTVRSPSYPSALTTFGYTQVVERIVNRLKQFRAGEESLLTVAYYGLTEISEACTGSGQRGNRPAVASKYRIDIRVLNTMGSQVPSEETRLKRAKLEKNRLLQRKRMVGRRPIRTDTTSGYCRRGGAVPLFTIQDLLLAIT